MLSSLADLLDTVLETLDLHGYPTASLDLGQQVDAPVYEAPESRQRMGGSVIVVQAERELVDGVLDVVGELAHLGHPALGLLVGVLHPGQLYEERAHVLQLCSEKQHLAAHAHETDARAAQHGGQLLQDGSQGPRGGAHHGTTTRHVMSVGAGKWLGIQSKSTRNRTPMTGTNPRVTPAVLDSIPIWCRGCRRRSDWRQGAGLETSVGMSGYPIRPNGTFLEIVQKLKVQRGETPTLGRLRRPQVNRSQEQAISNHQGKLGAQIWAVARLQRKRSAREGVRQEPS